MVPFRKQKESPKASKMAGHSFLSIACFEFEFVVDAKSTGSSCHVDGGP